MGWLRRAGQVLLQVEGSPDRVAGAFALGVFIAFFPIIGIHTPVALLLAIALRLNKVAMLIGVWVNNPWTVAPMFSAGTLFGCFLLRVSPSSVGEIDWSLSGWAFYHSLVAGLSPLLLPFLVGNVLLGILSAAASFLVLRMVLVRRERSSGSPSGRA
jgi:hypothetical protein